MKKGITSALVLMVSASMLLAACGGAAESKTDTGASAGKGDKKATINFVHWRGEDTESFKSIIAKFEQENPNIHVDMTVYSSGDPYTNGLQALILSGEGADVFASAPGAQFTNLLKSQTYEDLTNAPLLKNFSPDLIEAGKADGKQYAIPYQLVYNVPVYNKGMLDKLGLQPPKDWDGFLAMCQKLKESGVTPILYGYDVTPGQLINTLVMNNMPDKDAFPKFQTGAAKVTDPWFVKTLEQFKVLVDKEYIQKNATGTKYEGALALFAQEKGAILAAGSYAMATIAKQNPNIVQGLLAPITTSAGDMKYEGVHTTTFMLGINKKSKFKEEAKKFVEFLTKPEIASQYANDTGQLLTVNNVKYESKELGEQGKWTTKKTVFQPRLTITNKKVETAVNESLNLIVSGESVQKTIAATQAEIDRNVTK
ncbi:ABC transporter substrate-binding protein [Paenibacillus thalictri]|uniref:Extracellular solute-binding protein n=1 Tax=Paenibacillus thalictri TaxID=2527873 RepID=A0A4Q9DJ38_9BACL|nr:extracellular solute-binding protein [Paenibacillus thalictri]TBL73369.1 extracellular solute-binding protein [Paenibacillus thalictri]